MVIEDSARTVADSPYCYSVRPLCLARGELVGDGISLILLSLWRVLRRRNPVTQNSSRSLRVMVYPVVASRPDELPCVRSSTALMTKGALHGEQHALLQSSVRMTYEDGVASAHLHEVDGCRTEDGTFRHPYQPGLPYCTVGLKTFGVV